VITEVKYGDMGMMFRPKLEVKILDQAQMYVDIANKRELRGGIRYVINTEEAQSG
jgi:hypothetical protein